MPIVDPEKVRTRLGLPFPLSNATRSRIVDALEDSEATVVAFLNRASLAADERTLAGLYADERYPLDDVRAWPHARSVFDDRFRVVSWVPAAAPLDPALFDVTFKVGLDVAGDPELAPIRRFILQDAVAALRADTVFTESAGMGRTITSLSTEGQSVSYDKAQPAASGQAGAALTLKDLRRWKRLALGSPRARHGLYPWPYADRIW